MTFSQGGPPTQGAGVRRAAEVRERYDDLQRALDGALEEMATEEAGGLDPQGRGLVEFCRRTGLTRLKARTTKSHAGIASPAASWGPACVTIHEVWVGPGRPCPSTAGPARRKA